MSLSFHELSGIFMGEQFWWFYDVAAVAVVLICVFISGRRGLTKALTSLVGGVLAFAIALTVSGNIASSLYRTTLRDSNVKKLAHSLEGKDLTEDMKAMLESFGYNIKVDYNKLDEILHTGDDLDENIYNYVNNINSKIVDSEEQFYEKLHEGYGDILKRYVGEELSEFAAATAEKKVIDKPEKMEGLTPLMNKYGDTSDEQITMVPVAKYIVTNFVCDAYIEFIRLITFIVLLVAVIVIMRLVFNAFLDDDSAHQSIASHTIGGVVGVIYGAVYVVAVAAMIRLYVILGSNEMLFFNFKAIDKTYLFKYFYKFITKTM